jgi:hypothetical protein
MIKILLTVSDMSGFTATMYGNEWNATKRLAHRMASSFWRNCTCFYKQSDQNLPSILKSVWGNWGSLLIQHDEVMYLQSNVHHLQIFHHLAFERESFLQMAARFRKQCCFTELETRLGWLWQQQHSTKLWQNFIHRHHKTLAQNSHI